jgi:hypothetical protein
MKENRMNRLVASIVTFAATVAAAALAAALMSGSAFADDGAVEMPFNGATQTVPLGAGSWQLSHLSANALKRDYVVCERATTNSQLDFATPAACAALYEELRVRVFGGNLDALLNWFREAWYGRAE